MGHNFLRNKYHGPLKKQTKKSVGPLFTITLSMSFNLRLDFLLNFKRDHTGRRGLWVRNEKHTTNLPRRHLEQSVYSINVSEHSNTLI